MPLSNDDDGHDGTARAEQLFLADLSALVQRIDGVAHTHLQSLVGPTAAGATSLAWALLIAPGWALRLRLPLDPRSGAESIAVKYRGHDVTIDLHALALRYEDLQASGTDQRFVADEAAPPGHLGLLPRGVHRAPAGYRSIEGDFPTTYHLGRHGLPPSASVQDHARLRQFKAYLRLFDHVIANGVAQVDHLRELFSLNGGSAQSYWQQDIVHDDGGVSDAMLLAPPDSVRREVHAPFDRSSDRKNRALDHLLALHGVTYRQDSMRKFGAHLDADELDAWLLQNKAQYLREIVVIGSVRPRRGLRLRPRRVG